MSEDIFVKRVDFEVNNNQTSPKIKAIRNGDGPTDLEKADALKPESCTASFCLFLEKYKLKDALSHISLLLSLGLFCYGGGWVRITIFLSFFCTNRKAMKKLIHVEKKEFWTLSTYRD